MKNPWDQARAARPGRATVGDLLIYLFAAASLAVALTAGYRSLGPRAPSPEAARPIQVHDWREIAAHGRVIGDPGSPLRVVEFADFQCPSCARFASLLRMEKARALEPFHVAVLPLPLTAIHPHALQAAIAAECAGQQQRFGPFHDSLYARQSEIGIRSWSDFASESGVPSLSTFERCLSDSLVAAALTRKITKATQLGIMATPAFIVDGLLYPSGTPLEHIVSLLREKPKT